MTGSVLVTGAGGFIGRRLVGTLLGRGHAVTPWNRSDVDLTDLQAVKAAIEHVRPRTVFHLASSSVAPHNQQEDSISRDLAMTANLVATAQPGTVFIQAGSMAEYGASGRLREDHVCQPRTAYGRAKLACTEHALHRGEARGLQVRAARLFGVWGPGERSWRFIPTLLTKLRAGEPVALSDGSQRRDFIHVDDCCEVLVRIADLKHRSGSLLVNVGTGRAITLRMVCEQIANCLGADSALLRFGAVPRRETDEDVLEADTARLENLVNFVPRQRLGPIWDRETRRFLAIESEQE